MGIFYECRECHSFTIESRRIHKYPPVIRRILFHNQHSSQISFILSALINFVDENIIRGIDAILETILWGFQS